MPRTRTSKLHLNCKVFRFGFLCCQPERCLQRADQFYSLATHEGCMGSGVCVPWELRANFGKTIC